ncbi:MAG: cell division protein FtsQ/DivIB [Clostridia bacterium]
MDKKQKKAKTLYDFDYESKEEKKMKAKKKKADVKSASKKKNNGTSDKEEQREKYNDEIIIGVTKYPEKKPTQTNKEKIQQTTKIKKKNTDKNKKQNQTNKTKKQDNISNKQIAVNKEKKRKNVNKILKGLTLLLLITGTITFAMISPIFNLKNIIVNGNNQISKEEIISLAGIQLEENIFRISSFKTIDNIKQNAYINEVSINKKIPNTIEINIVERQPSYMLEYGNGYVYINNQGYMLEISSIKKELPIIIGTATSKESYKAGNRLDEEDLIKLGTVIKIMNSAQNSEISHLITTIDIKDADNYILYLETEKKTVYLGDCSNLETRMLFLVAILEKEKGIEGEIFINMNLNTDNAYFRESV